MSFDYQDWRFSRFSLVPPSSDIARSSVYIRWRSQLTSKRLTPRLHGVTPRNTVMYLHSVFSNADNVPKILFLILFIRLLSRIWSSARRTGDMDRRICRNSVSSRENLNFPDMTTLRCTFLLPRTKVLLLFGVIQCGRNVLDWVSFRSYQFSSPTDSTGILRWTSVCSELCLEARYRDSFTFTRLYIFFSWFLYSADVSKGLSSSISRIETSRIMIEAILDVIDSGHGKRSH